MDWWQERVWKMLYGELPKESNPDAQLITMRETAEAMLLDAYAGDPAVTLWLDAKGFTIEDLETETSRLTRALEGRRVPRPMIDIMKMREEVAEKRMALGKAVIIESVLEPALRGEKWALEKMLALGYSRVEDLETEANRLRKEIADPNEQRDILEVIEPLTLRNHTPENIVSLARFIQTEGAIGFSHHKTEWTPYVGMGMGIEEPVSLAGGWVSLRAYPISADTLFYHWKTTRVKALRIIRLIEPYLMADKWEEARYVLNIGKSLPDTEYRPMYRGIVGRKIRPIFLYADYVDFPLKYGIIVRKGELFPEPLRFLGMRYEKGKPIYWYRGMRM